MFNLNAKIKVYDTVKLVPTPKFYEFTYVKKVEISSSYKSLTDTASFEMPKKVYTSASGFKQSGTANLIGKQGTEKSIRDFFKLESFVEIYLGYDGDYKPAFRGYVTAVKGDSPVTIECEDMMYALKKVKAVDDGDAQPSDDNLNAIATNPTLNEEKFNPKQFFVKRVKQLGLPIKINALDEDMGNLLINRNHSIAQVFEMLKNKGIYTYFKIEKAVPVLTITNNPQHHSAAELGSFIDRNFIKSPLAGALVKKLINKGLDLLSSQLDNAMTAFGGDLFSGKARFRFHYNIISDNLTVLQEATRNTRIRVEKYFPNSNTPIHVEMGDPNGQLFKTYVLHDNETELPNDATAFKKKALETASELYQYAALRAMENKPNGLEGYFETFGEPFVRPTDKVVLENNKDDDKNGTFQVEKVERSYGDGGYRQKIYLGRRVEVM